MTKLSKSVEVRECATCGEEDTLRESDIGVVKKWRIIPYRGNYYCIEHLIPLITADINEILKNK